LKWIYVPPQLKLDGIDAYIQMPLFLKQSWEFYNWWTHEKSVYHQYFTWWKIDQAFLLINSFLEENEFVLKFPSHKTIVEKIENDVVIIGVYYWYKTDEIKAPEIN
jgi:hypothetical protein